MDQNSVYACRRLLLHDDSSRILSDGRIFRTFNKNLLHVGLFYFLIFSYLPLHKKYTPQKLGPRINDEC